MDENTSSIVVETFPVGFLQCNCTIIADTQKKEAIVVDPGGDADKILARLKELDVSVKQILHTHGHFDHFLASGEMKKATGAQLAIHKEDEFLWNSLEKQCGMFGIPYSPAPPPDHWIEDEEEITLPQCQGICLHTPGHTPGSTSFYFKDLSLLIAGDTLFRGSIGRTDLWGGDFPTIERSIRTRLYTLDEETTVITGHGPATSIGREIQSNPFVQPA